MTDSQPTAEELLEMARKILEENPGLIDPSERFRLLHQCARDIAYAQISATIVTTNDPQCVTMVAGAFILEGLAAALVIKDGDVDAVRVFIDMNLKQAVELNQEREDRAKAEMEMGKPPAGSA